MITLDYRDARPIYEQVRDGFCRLIASGAILPGEKLPSVRALATALAINPNTIQRAYEALEAEGYTYTVSGRGTFAAEPAAVNAGRRAELLRRFDAAWGELLALGVSPGELAARIGKEAHTP